MVRLKDAKLLFTLNMASMTLDNPVGPLSQV